MQVNLAKTAGFCFGVDRAVNLVYDLLAKGKKVCTLGPIIHNQQLVDDLISKGVKIIDDVSDCPEGYTVIIRTHGVEKEVIDKAENNKVNFINATCPPASLPGTADSGAGNEPLPATSQRQQAQFCQTAFVS